MPRRRMEIVPGQRFVSRGTYPRVWEVIGLHETPGDPHLHVKLARYGYRSDFKTISASALLDRRWFDLVFTPTTEFKRRPGRISVPSFRRIRSRLRLGIPRTTVDG